MNRPPALSEQRGAAVVVAILITALVAVIGVRMGNEYQLTFRRTSNVLLGDQATLFLISAENIARQLLMADKDDEGDHRGEPWGTQYPPVPIGKGMLAPEPLADLQARFNINSLTRGLSSGQQNQLTYGPQQKMFIRLLQTFDDLDMDRGRAEAITDAVIDWIDEDNSERGFNGAENLYYGELAPPYRTANGPMRSITELRLVKGVDAELFQALAPHVAALDTDVFQININTATANILQALGYNAPDQFTPLSKAEIEAYLEQTDPAVAMTQEAFVAMEPWQRLLGQAGQGGVQNAMGEYGFTSRYYSMTSHARLGELTIPMRSVLRVDDNTTVKVLSRSTGSL